MFFFFSFEELPEKISQLRHLNKNQSRTKSNAKRERDERGMERGGEKVEPLCNFERVLAILTLSLERLVSARNDELVEIRAHQSWGSLQDCA